MGEVPIPDSVKAHISGGEAVLWAHVCDKPVAAQMAELAGPQPHRIWMGLFLVLGVIYAVLYVQPPFGGQDNYLRIVFIFGLNLAVIYIVFRIIAAARVRKVLANRFMFLNVAVTPQKVIAFNPEAEPLIIARTDITDIKTKVYGERPVLRLKTTIHAQNISILGLPDFTDAKQFTHALGGQHHE